MDGPAENRTFHIKFIGICTSFDFLRGCRKEGPGHTL